MDFDKVPRYSFNPGIGATETPQGVIVKAEHFDSLLADYKETRRALENIARREAMSGAHAQKVCELWIAEARTELAQEAMQGRAE